MSQHIIPLALEPRNFNEILELWLEVYEERGENLASIGIIQLILDKLKESCTNASLRGCSIPETTDLSQFDMEGFIRNWIDNQEFDGGKQKLEDGSIAQLIALLVDNSNDTGWMIHVQKCLRILFKCKTTALLVSKTMVHFYVAAVMLQTEPNLDRDFKAQLNQICQQLVRSISKNDHDYDAMHIVVASFFDRISKRPLSIRTDANGCERIIAKFLSFEDTAINIAALREIIRYSKNRNYGDHMLRLCSSQHTLDALSEIIADIKGIKVQELALTLACRMQELIRDRNLFNIQVFEGCVLSENQKTRQMLAQLCRLALRGPTRDIANPSDVLIRATKLHQRFRRNYTTCPMRLINTFFAEFTDWEAVFRVVGMRLNDQIFVNEFFQLVRRVIEQISNRNDTEELQRTYSHAAIEFLQHLDRQYVKIYGDIIYTINVTDELFILTDREHCEILTDIVSAISTDYFTDYTQQSNLISMGKQLYRKGFIGNALWQTEVLEILNGMNFEQLAVDRQTDFDLDPNMLNVFMKMCVFAEHNLFADQAALVCKRSREIVMMRHTELTRNRHFLAYNLLSLVNTYITIFKSGAQASIPGITQAEISGYLFRLLEQTQDNFDFLCVAIFWCLSDMEIHFKMVSQFTNPNVLVQNLVKKVSLVIVNDNGVEHIQMFYLKYMVVRIVHIIQNGTLFDLRDLVVHIYRRFPDYEFTFDLLRCCAIRSMIDVQNTMFTDCVLRMVDALHTKKLKEKFLKAVDAMITGMPNETDLRQDILRTGMNRFGATAQQRQQNNSIWQKNARQICSILHDVTLKNTVLQPER